MVAQKTQKSEVCNVWLEKDRDIRREAIFVDIYTSIYIEGRKEKMVWDKKGSRKDREMIFF